MTLTADVKKRYRALRRDGHVAHYALWEARIMSRWTTLELCGYVRFQWVPDEDVDIAFLEGDTYSEAANPDIRPSLLERERKAFHERIERDGVWGLCGQYRLSESADWKDGDAVWGFVGTERNGYEATIAIETIRQLTETLKSRCPQCRKEHAP